MYVMSSTREEVKDSFLPSLLRDVWTCKIPQRKRHPKVEVRESFDGTRPLGTDVYTVDLKVLKDTSV